MAAGNQRVLLALFALSSVAALAGSASGFLDVLPYVLPPLLMLFPLLAGRFVGERHIERLRRAVQGRRCRRPGRPPSAPAPRPILIAFPRGGRLMARALAVRPPPVSVGF